LGNAAAQSAAAAQACIKLGELLEVRSDPAVVKLRSMMAEHVQQARDGKQNHTHENGVDETICETAMLGQRIHNHFFAFYAGRQSTEVN
jgi:hypothetical protein